MKKKSLRSKRRGQVILEYILTIFAIVGFVMAAYIAIRQQVLQQLPTIQAKIGNSQTGYGGQPAENYYQNTEYQVK